MIQGLSAANVNTGMHFVVDSRRVLSAVGLDHLAKNGTLIEKGHDVAPYAARLPRLGQRARLTRTRSGRRPSARTTPLSTTNPPPGPCFAASPNRSSKLQSAH